MLYSLIVVELIVKFLLISKVQQLINTAAKYFDLKVFISSSCKSLHHQGKSVKLN